MELKNTGGSRSNHKISILFFQLPVRSSMKYLLTLLLLIFFCLPSFALYDDWKALEEKIYTDDSGSSVFDELTKADWQISMRLPGRYDVNNWKRKVPKYESITKERLETFLDRQKKKDFLVVEYTSFGGEGE